MGYKIIRNLYPQLCINPNTISYCIGINREKQIIMGYCYCSEFLAPL